MRNGVKRHKISTKIILMFLALLVLVIVAIGFATYRISYNSVLDEYNDIAADVGELAASIVNTESIDNWIKNGADDEYLRTEEILKSLKKNFGLAYLYMSLPCFDDSGNMINDTIYVFDIMLDGDDPEFFGTVGETSGAVDVYEQCKVLYETNTVIKSDVVTSSDFGWLLSVYVPVDDKEGSVVGWFGVDIDMTALINNIRNETFTMVSLIVLMITVFAIVFIIYITRSMVKPVKELSRSMNRFVLGGSELNYKPVTTIKTNDEIEQMADDFNQMADSIINYMANLEKTTTEKERMRADLDVSAQIRASLSSLSSYPVFPDRTDFDIYGSMSNTIFNKSSFCDCFLTDENHLFLVVGEASGRSLSSMLFAMLAATNIKCFARMGYQPYRIAMETNNQLSSNSFSRNDLTVEALIAEIDLKTGTMKYVNAGMPPVLLKKTGESFAFESVPTQFNLGEMPNVSFSQETISLSQGNMVMLVSNGVPTMRDKSGMEFTEAYVESSISRISAEHYDLKEMVDRMENALEEFRQGASLESDTSMLIFRYFG